MNEGVPEIPERAVCRGGNPPYLTPDGKLKAAKKCGYQRPYQRCIWLVYGKSMPPPVSFLALIEAKSLSVICGSKVMQGVSIRATNDERSTPPARYTDSATYQIGKTITVMANCLKRNGGSGAITVTIVTDR